MTEEIDGSSYSITGSPEVGSVFTISRTCREYDSVTDLVKV